MARHQTEVLILGSGPAGLTAAIYAARANLKPLLVHGIQPGGQMTITTDVENYPGFADVIQGPWLMEQMQKQAELVGTRLASDTIMEVNLKERPFMCRGDMGDLYYANSLIISTGAQARWLGLNSEEKYKGFGVSACATCDGFFFREKDVVVIGGGNTAVEEALYLTHHANSVTVIHRRDTLRAEKILQERLFKNPKVRIIWNSIVEEVVGHDEPLAVKAVKLRDISSGLDSVLETDGVFVAIGHTPNTNLFIDQLETDKDGYIITNNNSTRTSVPGVFAAGDVQDNVYRQAVTAAGTGCMAALEVEKFLAESVLVDANIAATC